MAPPATSPSGSPAAAIARAAVRWGVAGALAVLTFELVLRPIYSIHMASDPELGAIIAPGSTVRWGIEGWGTSRWAERGVRVEAADPSRPSVLVLGDSQTESLMVDDAEVFTTLTERHLQKAKPTARVLNAGKSSHSVADYVALAPRYRAAFAPKWVVVQVRDSDFGSDAFHENKRHFERTGAGVTVVDVAEPTRGRLGGIAWAARQRSSFFGYSVVRFGKFRAAAAQDAPLFHASQAKHDEAPSGEAAELAADFPLDAELDLLVKAWDGRVTILYLPELDPKHPERVSSIGAWLAARCRAQGVSFVTLADAFGGMLARGRSPYGFANTHFNEGHMNAEGQAATAGLLAAELERLGVP